MEPRTSFDKKFGESYLSSLPTTPAVYFIYNDKDELIYIGKAKNLRRRLSQYRNAKRRKRHRKMRQIVAEAHRIHYDLYASDLEACLKETALIQHHRPKWNVEGAFYFLYPMIGILYEGGILRLCLTTQPEKLTSFGNFQFHGAFRSRHFSGEAFFALGRLLKYVGHPVKIPAKKRRESLPKYSYCLQYRGIPPEFFELWNEFWSGKSKRALEELILALVENAGARRKPKLIQKELRSLSRFWRFESKFLANIRESTGYETYPVPQRERDLLVLKHRMRPKVKPGSGRAPSSDQSP
jgi:excinuclease ABC subunit C